MSVSCCDDSIHLLCHVDCYVITDVRKVCRVFIVRGGQSRVFVVTMMLVRFS